MYFEQINKSLLAPADLDKDLLNKALNSIMEKNIDYGDIYLQKAINESWVIEDGIIKSGSFNIEKGLGVRAITGHKTGFSYADSINFPDLMQSVTTARSIARSKGNGKAKIITDHVKFNPIYPNINPLETTFDKEQKVTFLKEADAFARSLNPLIKQVIISLNCVYEEVLIAGTDGTFATDIRPLVRFNCSILVEKNNIRERGSSGGGARLDYSFFLKEIDNKPRYQTYIKEAVRQALVNLDAVAAPAGSMPVILGAGWPAVLLHEAVGHGLEGDFIRKGSSMFNGKLEQKVASDLCTIVDDATMQNRRGSLSIDDEGVAGQKTTLIENGILKGYMYDKLNANLMNTKSTGNGRRESYADLPIPRMTNTYMLAGQSKLEDMIKSVKHGIYAPNFGGGQVDITSGNFVFSASEAYLIENGKITTPVKGASLIGSGIEVMQQISMVGDDLELDQGVGVCGKDGQSVPVGVGQPSLKLDKITVGGTA